MIHTGISKDDIRAYCNGMSARATTQPAAVDEATLDFYMAWLNPDTRPAEDLSSFRSAWARFNRA
jgi:hypothetical protein